MSDDARPGEPVPGSGPGVGDEFDPEDAFGHDVLDPTGTETDRWVDGDDDDIDV